MADPARLSEPCEFVILGASGDLSRKKLLPALFTLFSTGLLPERFAVVGYGRAALADADFRELIAANLTCRYAPGNQDHAACARLAREFLAHCHFVSGRYDDVTDVARLRTRPAATGEGLANRLVYLALPPSAFLPATRSLHAAGLFTPPAGGWCRVVVEKPFGRDRETSDALGRDLAALLPEEQTYRIDHYLGKEVIQNLLVLRFANLVFEPLWNRDHVAYVSIAFAEDHGCEGRAGYFDQYGIVRDVIQNHLLQILALVAMEQPLSLGAGDIADEKVRLLRAVRPLTPDDVILGQYTAGASRGQPRPGYRDDPAVPRDSLTATYAHATLAIANPRWSGVPFYLSAGKALNTRRTEIHVQFQTPPHSVFTASAAACANDLHIRIQPAEAIELHVANKVPGLNLELATVKLDMLYHDTFRTILPEAYERLLLDVLRGDRSLFIQARELAASWDIVTPVLRRLEACRIQPLPYAYGSAGPRHGLPA